MASCPSGRGGSKPSRLISEHLEGLRAKASKRLRAVWRQIAENIVAILSYQFGNLRSRTSGDVRQCRRAAGDAQ